MTTIQLDKQLNNKISEIVDQKMLEFFGDPDNGLTPKKGFLLKLYKNMCGSRKFITHTEVLKKYGLSTF